MAVGQEIPVYKDFTFSESGLNVTSAGVTRTYALGRDDWQWGAAIVRNDSPNTATPANTSREKEGGVFYFTRTSSETIGESQTSYRVQFSTTYNEQVIRPFLFPRATIPFASFTFLGQNDPGRRILMNDIYINGSDLEIRYSVFSVADDLDCSIYVRVYNTRDRAFGY